MRRHDRLSSSEMTLPIFSHPVRCGKWFLLLSFGDKDEEKP
jgi:hypothetical protein